MASVDVSNRRYSTAEQRHYTPDYFNKNIAHKILGANDITWKNASGQQSCAMRLSIALAYAGVHWPRIKNSWRLKDTNVYFPSSAGDYPNLLKHRENINSANDIKGRKGVVYFGGGFTGASGHVTLWNGTKCHFNDAHWGQPKKYFWEMS